MPAFTDLTGLAGIAAALVAMTLAIPGIRRLPPPFLIALLVAVFILVLMPLGPLPVAAYVRGVTGDLSFTTLLLLGATSVRRYVGRPAADAGNRRVPLAFIAATALVLYPMALGLGSFDPYRLGYGSPWLLGALFAIALTAWRLRFLLIATIIALAVLGWTVRWYESGNLWDYLLDPLVSLYALGALAVHGTHRILSAFRMSRHGAAEAGSITSALSNTR